MQTDVSIVRCESYEPAECRRALEAVLRPLGGLDWVRPGMRVVIKVNLVAAMKPEQAATTHPALLCELVKMLTARGASVLLGDSPGGLYTAAHVNHVYDAAGLHACELAGAELNRDFSQAQATCPEAKCARQFQYTAYLDQADAIIDFCKLKTHGMMGMTNAVKNFFGVIPGTMKPEYHYKYPKIEDFADMIVDLCEYFKPRLAICDAVVGMEGNGPTQGSPRHIGAVAASLSAHQLDLACAKLLGFTAQEIPTLKAACARGLIPETPEELQIEGDLDSFIVPDFKTLPPQKSVGFRYGGDGWMGKLTGKFVSACLTPRPQVKKDACVGCKKCANICPAKAITMTDGRPVIDRSRCIRCFCCQEFCPKGAMKVKRPLVARILNR